MRLEGLERARWARERCTGGSKRTGALQAIGRPLDSFRV